MYIDILFHVLFFILVTRSKKFHIEAHAIVKECYISIKRNRRADAMAWLNHQNQPKRILQRRATVSGRNLFSVHDDIRETGFDFMERVSANNCVANVTNQTGE